MSSTPPYADLSNLYASNRQLVQTNTMPAGIHEADSLLTSRAASLAPSTTTDLLLQRRQLWNLEDPRAALLLGMPSTTAYETELALQAQASDVFRRYNELKVLEAASAAVNPNLSAFSIPSELLAATMAPVAASTAIGPIGMTALSVKEPALNDLEQKASGTFVQRDLGQAYSAFSRLKRQSGGIAGVGVPPASLALAMKSANGASKPSDVLQEDEEAFFRSSGAKERFPTKLYRMIHEMKKEGRSDVVSFLPHGKAFAINDEQAFVNDVMPRYFANCQLSSFQKQLNLYGFHKITVGKDKGKLRYFHTHFRQGRPSLCDKIQRRRTSAAAKRKQQA